MIQLGEFDPFNCTSNPVRVTAEIIKVQDLTGKVSDDKFNKKVDIANLFRKKSQMINLLVGLWTRK